MLSTSVQCNMWCPPLVIGVAGAYFLDDRTLGYFELYELIIGYPHFLPSMTIGHLGHDIIFSLIVVAGAPPSLTAFEPLWAFTYILRYILGRSSTVLNYPYVDYRRVYKVAHLIAQPLLRNERGTHQDVQMRIAALRPLEYREEGEVFHAVARENPSTQQHPRMFERDRRLCGGLVSMGVAGECQESVWLALAGFLDDPRSVEWGAYLAAPTLASERGNQPFGTMAIDKDRFGA